MSYVSVIGYYVYKDDGEPIKDGGLWMVYETADVEKAVADFREVADDLMFDRQMDEDREIEFAVDVIQPMSAPPKMWRDRIVQKL